MKKPACIIVDPFVAPHILTHALIEQGIEPIALLVDTWSDPAWKADRIKKAKFAKIIECYNENQLNDLPQQLQDYEILGFVYGREGLSIQKADNIARRFFPQFANPGASEPRIDKYVMHETCRQAGLLVPKQIRIFSESEYQQHHEFIASLLPAIVKPTHSSGSRGVTLCKTLDEVQNAVHHLFQQTYDTGKVDELLIQEQLLGMEYYVDSVSINGKHQICSVHRYNKIPYKNRFIYRWDEALDKRSDESQQCIAYVTKALDAVQLHHGFGHTEVFLTPQGPALIEINARMSGGYGMANKLTKYIYNSNQPEFYAQAISGKADVTTSTAAPLQHGLLICLQNWEPRTIGPLNVAALKKLSSYRDHLMVKEAGTYLKDPESLQDMVAYALLTNTSEAQLFSDAETVIALEKAKQLF